VLSRSVSRIFFGRPGQVCSCGVCFLLRTVILTFLATAFAAVGCRGEEQAVPEPGSLMSDTTTEPGLEQLSLSPNGDFVAIVVLDPGKDVRVVTWDADNTRVSTIWKNEEGFSVGALVPGSTPSFACWSTYRSPAGDTKADTTVKDRIAYWYDGAKVRKDQWHSESANIFLCALPSRASYVVKQVKPIGPPGERDMKASLIEVKPADGRVVTEFDLDALPHKVPSVMALYLEDGDAGVGPLLWLSTFALGLLPGHGAFEDNPRAWIDVLSWRDSEPYHLDSIELMHESWVWNMASSRTPHTVLALASPSFARADNNQPDLAATPLRLQWDINTGRISVHSGMPLMIRWPCEDRSEPASSAVTAGSAYISKRSLFYVLKSSDEECSVMRVCLEDYREKQVLPGPVASGPDSVVVCPSSDALVTWNGFTFDLYGPSDGDKWANYGKVGTWTLGVDEKGEIEVALME
jgi:hypothetical protein